MNYFPKFWSLLSKKPESSAALPQQPNPSRWKWTVTDISTWVQCFATYISVLSSQYPEAVLELLAYLIFILHVSQDFGGVAWVAYDVAFRRQAFITGSRQWSKVNPSLYSICFSGVAWTGRRCELCLSLSHATQECALVSGPDPDLPARMKSLESAVLAIVAPPAHQQVGRSRTLSLETCRNWNLGRCCFPQCRYLGHACRVCGGPNPAISCCDRRLGPRPPWQGGNALVAVKSVLSGGDPRLGPQPHVPLTAPDRLGRSRESTRPY